MPKLIRLLLVPIALALVGIMRFISPWFLVRIGEIWTFRVGHLAGNTECYLCERDAGMHKGNLDIWSHKGPYSNKVLAKKLDKNLLLDPTRFIRLVDLVNKMFRGWEKHVVESEQFDRDIHNLFEKYPPHISITEREERKGQKLLRKMGIPEGSKWVCLIVRDSAYLPHLVYHRHRDSDIKSYLLAALELASRGYYVIRMGAKVSSHMAIKHTKIIDYATNGMRSEFMDVYLGAKCEFCISTGTGFDAIPMIFRKPIVYVNYAPLEYLMTFVNPSLAIWKHHVKDGKKLSPEEIYKANLGQCLDAVEYQNAGVKLEENTMEEIRDVVLEMADLVEGKRSRSLYDMGLQSAFWMKFPRAISPFNGKPLHGEIRMQIGQKFLRGYSEPVEADRAA